MLPKRSVTLICGVSGSGKTSFAFRYLVNVHVACRFIFDPDGEAAQRLDLPAAATARELEEDLATGWVLYDPHAMFPGQLPQAFRFFCEWAYEAAGRGPGRKILLVDEVWKYCGPLTIPQELALCIQTGRKRGLETVFCTQRPNRLNEAITNEVSELVCFRLQGENAVRFVDSLAGRPLAAPEMALGSFLSLNLDSGANVRGKLF
ncbi:MAG: type IV secretory system conjugative DNA transfer family protein [Verrucomicrobiae bacterium]|nr:type IV secretory system conjugative DNA transfer family protein [Verrucomicrobiae bacterium]